MCSSDLDNLPNVVVNELEIDYVESKLYAATYGRGIWAAELMNPATGTEPDPAQIKNIEAVVSPNPCHGIFFLSLLTEKDNEVKFELIDVTGLVVLTENLHISAGHYSKTFDISQHPAGVYFAKISSGNQSKVCRILKD